MKGRHCAVSSSLSSSAVSTHPLRGNDQSRSLCEAMYITHQEQPAGTCTNHRSMCPAHKQDQVTAQCQAQRHLLQGRQERSAQCVRITWISAQGLVQMRCCLADRTQHWAQWCDDGDRDACNWASTGSCAVIGVYLESANSLASIISVISLRVTK